MVLRFATVFRAPVSKHPQEFNGMGLKERLYTVIEQIRCYQCCFAVIHFGKGH